ncbi:hypothetical protein [Pseudomonas sp. CLCA07]
MGYAHLIDALDLNAIEVKRPAIIQPVTRLEKIGGALSVPQSVAPAEDDYLAHSRLPKIILSRYKIARSLTPLIAQPHSVTNRIT